MEERQILAGYPSRSPQPGTSGAELLSAGDITRRSPVGLLLRPWPRDEIPRQELRLERPRVPDLRRTVTTRGDDPRPVRAERRRLTDRYAP